MTNDQQIAYDALVFAARKLYVRSAPSKFRISHEDLTQREFSYVDMANVIDAFAAAIHKQAQLDDVIDKVFQYHKSAEELDRTLLYV